MLGQNRERSSNPRKNELFVSPADYDFSRNPALLERVLASSHGYFRFINVRFGQVVCTRYKDMLRGAPRLNLHGDAHVEQYAVTDLGRGLTDFDDSATGPGVLDLVRFGVSLHLAARARGWEEQIDKVFDQFLEGYRRTLSDPEDAAPEPQLVSRIRSGFKTDRSEYFRWVESIMGPLPGEMASRLRKAFKPYIRQMLLEDPDLGADFFTIKSMGSLKLGIGSALDQKFLVRVEGPTPDPTDDVVLELKEVRDLSGIPCIQAARNDPFRILLSQARIAYNPFRYLGYLRMEGKAYWSHSWVENYEEIEITETIRNPRELEEVAFDVGAQLGLGHPKQIASPLDLQLRQEQILFLAAHAKKLPRICRDLAKEIVSAWAAFRAAAEKPGR